MRTSFSEDERPYSDIMNHQNEVFKLIREMHNKLIWEYPRGNIMYFSRLLVCKHYFKHETSFVNVLGLAYKRNRKTLLPKDIIEKYESILKEFENFKPIITKKKIPKEKKIKPTKQELRQIRLDKIKAKIEDHFKNNNGV